MLPKFSSKAFLAPMAGVSDPALRLQCKKLGAGLVVTEFTNIHSIVAKEKQLKENQNLKFLAKIILVIRTAIMISIPIIVFWF